MLRNLVVVSLVAFTVVSPLTAQRANTREKFWIGFGLGTGSAAAECQSCTGDRASGLSGHLRMGGTVSKHVLLGGETNGWVYSESGIDETLGFASFIVVVYPSAAGAFFLKFGLGAMSYVANDGVDELTATAPAGSFGLGYEFRVGRNFSIAPYLNSLATSAAKFKINGQPAPTSEDITASLVQLGVGVTWH